MPSSFSPNLRLELIAPGEQAGTWGTTTNTNLGTLVEDAISGYVSVTISSADQALTANNGSADQARNAIIELVSAPSAFAVYAPPESKLYTIFNNTSYTATIYNSTALGNTTAAGAGVAIPAGKIVTVWSDGTDFAFQNTHIVGTVVGNVTGNLTGNVTGNLTGNVTGNVNGQLSGTVASGVTGTTQSPGTNNTTLATTAFTVAAVTAATGSLGTMSTQNANNVSISGGAIAATFTGNLTGNVTGNAATATTANNALGVGQSWQDLTGSRSLNQDYTNSTGRSIQVTCNPIARSGTTATVVVGGVTILMSTTLDCCGVPQISYFPFSFVVPPGAVYRVNGSFGFTIWAELR